MVIIANVMSARAFGDIQVKIAKIQQMISNGFYGCGLRVLLYLLQRRSIIFVDEIEIERSINCIVITILVEFCGDKELHFLHKNENPVVNK